MSDLVTANTVVHLAIDAPDALTLPVLLELSEVGPPAVSLSVAKFARYLQRQGMRSYATLRKYVSAIGKLKDYYTLVRGGESVPNGELGSLIEEFLYAYDHGTVLGWHAICTGSSGTYQVCRGSISRHLRIVRRSPQRRTAPQHMV